MKILNYEFEDFDFEDANNIEKIEKAIPKTKEKLDKISEKGKYSEQVKDICQVVFDFFNEVFGEGTDKKIFGDKQSARLCFKAFDELFEEKNKQEVEFQEEMNKFQKKYGVDRISGSNND